MVTDPWTSLVNLGGMPIFLWSVTMLAKSISANGTKSGVGWNTRASCSWDNPLTQSVPALYRTWLTSAFVMELSIGMTTIFPCRCIQIWFWDKLWIAFMSLNQGRPRISRKLLLSGMSMMTKVAGADTAWVVMATVANMPNGVTGGSFAIRKMNLAFFGWDIPRYFCKVLLITLTLEPPLTNTLVSS